MTSSPFVPDLYLPDLSVGTGLALNSFRACAVGRAGCSRVLANYDRAFGAEGPAVLCDMLAFARLLGMNGRRTVNLAQPGCPRMTADEVSITALFGAAQMQEVAARDAHLLWLLAQSPSEEASALTSRIAKSFADYGLRIDAPAAAFRTGAPARILSLVPGCGHA